MSKKKRRRHNRPRSTPQTRSQTAPSQPPEPQPADQLAPTAQGTDHTDHVDADQIHLLLQLLADGVLDAHLETLEAAIGDRHRARHLAATHQAATDLHIGDRVRLSHQIRPQYLHGATGTITGWAHTNAIIKLDTPTGRFTHGEIRCPPLGLQRLTE